MVQSSMRPEQSLRATNTPRRAALNFEPPDPGPELTVERIIEQVGRRFGISAADVVQTRGRKNLARDAALLLARELLLAPVEELAKRFNVGKSAVSEAVRRAKQRTPHEPWFVDLLASFEQCD